MVDLRDRHPIIVRGLTGRDLAAAAALHASELPDGFLAQLGSRFLRRYLATFLDTPGAVALGVAGDTGELSGFVVGSTRRNHNKTALRRHARLLLPAGAAALLIRPWLVLPFLRTRARRYLRAAVDLLRRTPSPATAAGGAPIRVAVLLHVAVHPAQRGRGLGAALVGAFADASRDAGCTRVLLVAFSENDFYLRLGWNRVTARQDDDGRLVVTYALDLGRAGAGQALAPQSGRHPRAQWATVAASSDRLLTMRHPAATGGTSAWSSALRRRSPSRPWDPAERTTVSTWEILTWSHDAGRGPLDALRWIGMHEAQPTCSAALDVLGVALCEVLRNLQISIGEIRLAPDDHVPCSSETTGVPSSKVALSEYTPLPSALG